MMIERAIAVQTQIFQHLEQALAPLLVTTAPTGAERYVRIDAFTAVDDNLYKETESSTHGFTVNVFDSPEGGSNSLAWVWNTLAAVHAALRELRIEGASLRPEDSQALFEPRATDGTYTARGYIRYRVQIGA